MNDAGRARRGWQTVRALAFIGALVGLAFMFGLWVADRLATVPPGLIDRCREDPTSPCLAEIAWNLTRIETAEPRLGELARLFARLGQRERTDALLKAGHSAAGSLEAKYVAGERLALDLAEGRLGSLAAETDPLVLSTAVTRLIGYQPTEGQSKRFNRRLSEQAIGIDRPVALALLERWEQVSGGDAGFRTVLLANELLLLQETARARRIAERIGAVGSRDVVELWLRLGEPERALEAARAADANARGIFKMLVAEWLARNGGRGRTSEVAAEAAEDLLDRPTLGEAIDAVGLMVEAGRVDLARAFVLKAAEHAEKPGTFQPFIVADVGAMFGRLGESRKCLELQAKALGVLRKPGEGGAVGFVSGPVTYGSGRFSLGADLRQRVADHRVRCGEPEAMQDVDNRHLARQYCDYYALGLIKPAALESRPEKTQHDDAPRWFLYEKAAECHFERAEPAVATPLLRRLLEEARSTANHRAAHAAAELACVYGAAEECREGLTLAGRLLVEGARNLSVQAKEVVEFAVILRVRAR